VGVFREIIIISLVFYVLRVYSPATMGWGLTSRGSVRLERGITETRDVFRERREKEKVIA